VVLDGRLGGSAEIAGARSGLEIAPFARIQSERAVGFRLEGGFRLSDYLE
jgi:hypothetical protein